MPGVVADGFSDGIAQAAGGGAGSGVAWAGVLTAMAPVARLAATTTARNRNFMCCSQSCQTAPAVPSGSIASKEWH